MCAAAINIFFYVLNEASQHALRLPTYVSIRDRDDDSFIIRLHVTG